jgi:hypothetical protein
LRPELQFPDRLAVLAIRRSRTSGVSPIASVMESKTRPRPGRQLGFGFFAVPDRAFFMGKDTAL